VRPAIAGEELIDRSSLGWLNAPDFHAA
jgi:hypothetical protein